jgi:uncharacterized protein
MSTFSSQRLCAPVAVLLLFLLAAPFAPAQPAPAEKSFSREAMLRELAQHVISPGYADLAAQCRALTNAIGLLAAAQNQSALDDARKAWLAADAAADRLRCFQTGPVADRDCVPTFYYWQVIPNQIEGIVGDSSQAIGQPLLDNAGATVKGLYAMEYLLFDRRGGQPTEPAESARALDLLSASPRRMAYVLAVARDVEAKAGQLAGDWSATGAQGAMARFVDEGQNSIDRLVNQMAQSIENTIQNHLNFALVLPSPVSGQLYRIKGSRSGNSLQGVLATLEGMADLYRGGGGPGLGDAVKSLNPPLAARVQEGFNTAIAATRAVGEPLEQAVVDKREAIQSAVDQLRALEILFKVDLASTLGVTLTFTSGDGD